ncbi:MAG TPA: hypothetical protein VE196_13035 [Pseudonocardiaceae bacterium]|nr:hypothetical protein [Pseudonocardiaceae bacterium]
MTVYGQDDPTASLPIRVAPTARSGASLLFQVHGLITLVTHGDAQKCNATLFDDTGTKVAHQATPQAPLQVNVNGSYWVVAEVDGCSFEVTQKAGSTQPTWERGF